MTGQNDITAAGTPGHSVEARAALRAAWECEHQAATTARRAGDTDAEWSHLERAHILSQPLAGLHLRTHVAMLGAALRTRDGHETLGQLLRLALAAPAHSAAATPSATPAAPMSAHSSPWRYRKTSARSCSPSEVRRDNHPRPRPRLPDRHGRTRSRPTCRRACCSRSDWAAPRNWPRSCWSPSPTATSTPRRSASTAASACRRSERRNVAAPLSATQPIEMAPHGSTPS